MVIIFFSLIMAVALALMGLDIELNIVYETFKVILIDKPWNFVKAA